MSPASQPAPPDTSPTAHVEANVQGGVDLHVPTGTRSGAVADLIDQLVTYGTTDRGEPLPPLVLLAVYPHHGGLVLTFAPATGAFPSPEAAR